MSDKDFKLIKLERDNYVVWKWQFKNILRAKKLEGVLKEDAKDNEMDAQALALLGSALDEDNMLKIINCEKFRDAWRVIEVCFENKTAYEPQSLFRRLNSYRIESASDVSRGISEIRGIVAQLKNLNEFVSDNNLIGAILSALPASFDIFVTVWKNSSDQNVESLVSKLMAEASDQVSKESSETKALAARNYKDSKKKGKLNKDQCRYCRETGHWIKDCKKLKTPYDPNRNKKKPDKNEDGDQFDFACMTRSKPVMLSEDIWVADSGCTNHMSPYKHLFHSFTSSSDVRVIRLADDNICLNVEGQGEIITTNCKLINVLYVPELSQNLFSISAASMNGLTYVGTKDKISFRRENKEIFSAHLKNKLYLIKLEPKAQISACVKSATLSEWHSRFNHVSPETIKIMHRDKVVEGLDIATKNDEICEDCKMNKCTRTSHPLRSTPKATKPGTSLHVDTAGPCSVASLGGSKYFVLCKDEASGYRQVAFVSSKDQIASKVKQFITRASLETGHDVLKLMTDGGSEFKGELTKFLDTKGIIHEQSVPYTPFQNGYIERDIRTVKEAARTMLNKTKLDKSLWAEAIDCAVYTLNRVISSSNKKQTPYEIWHKSKPNVKNLRIFGELAVLKKTVNDKGTSWDSKGMHGIFVNYGDRFNTYKFLVGDKIRQACDVSFLNKLHNGEKITEKDQSSDFWCTQDCFERELGSSINDLSMEESTVSSATEEDEFHTDSQSSSHDRDLNDEAIEEGESTLVLNDNQNQKGIKHLTKDTIQAFINEHEDRETTIKSGNQMLKLKIGEIKFNENTGRWKSPSGHFIGRETIQQIINDTNNRPRATVARALMANVKIPESYTEACQSPQSEEWIKGMDDEMKSLQENEVYEVIPESQATKKAVGSRWVYALKFDSKGNIVKYKSRVVAKGYSQRYGIDYLETYCSVVQIMTTRLMLNHAAQELLHLRQFDIKTAFLYGKLHEEILMTPPEGYGQANTVWRLKRSLYGLRQSPRMWNERFSEVMTKIGLRASKYDNSVFFKLEPIVYVIVYVDDGLIIAKDESEIFTILSKLKEQFQMREMEVTSYRGLEIKLTHDEIAVHQSTFAAKILERFVMSYCKPSNNPMAQLNSENDEPLKADVPFRSVVGSLSYLAESTRPDIAFAVNQLAQKSVNPSLKDWKQAKFLLRYLKGTQNLGIKYTRGQSTEPSLIGFSDSDFAGHRESSKSTTGYVITFNGAPFHWKTQLQRHVTLSSTEAEVIALCTLAKELSWIRRMMIELHMIGDQPAIIKCDNQSALKIAQSEKATVRTRHLRAQDAFIREQIELNEIQLQHVKSDQQKADLLTKNVQTKKFLVNREMLLSTV